MRRFKALVLAVCGVCVLMASVLAATSAALPELLNAKKELTKASFTANEKAETVFTILNGFASTTCPETASESETEGTGVLGPFHINFKGGCTTSLGGTCTGLGDAAGTILVLGSFHIVYDTLSALGAAILFLLQHVHYSCTVLAVEKLILVLGQVLCLLSTINTLSKTNEVKCMGTGGDPKETRYWNDAGAEVNIAEGLLASENEGVTYKMSAQNGNVKLSTTEEIEVMA